MTVAYLNGEFLPLSKARVSVMDRGFLFGDGVYEVFAAYNGKLFGLEEHLQRLNSSLESIRLQCPKDKKTIKALLQELVEKNAADNQMVYLQVTRGSSEKRMLTFPENTQETLFAYSSPFEIPSMEKLALGISTISLENTRWRQCRTKAITLLANILLRQEAADAGADEAILIEGDNAVEGTSSNLFIVKNNVILTPSLNNHLLGGITRQVLLNIFEKEKMNFSIESISAEQLKNADEIWLTGTTREISPVVKLDGNPVGTGKSGPVWQQAIKHFRRYREALLNE